MKIQVFSPGSGWVLDAISRRICEADPDTFGEPVAAGKAIDHIQRPNPDGCLFWDIQNCWHPDFRQLYPQAIHVGAFTHLHADDANNFRAGWERLDAVVHMNQKYLATFIREKWYPAERMIVLRPGEVADQFPLRKVRIGVCQRGGHVGKGSEFLPLVIETLDQTVLDGLELWFMGKGWFGFAEQAQRTEQPKYPQLTFAPGHSSVSAIADEGEDAATYPEFFERLDYLLIPSLWEGGPMALLEALSCGIPVIAAEVGWVSDFAREAAVGDLTTFVPGDVEALKRLLTGLVAPRLRRRRLVEGMSYKRYAADLVAFFGRIKEMR